MAGSLRRRSQIRSRSFGRGPWRSIDLKIVQGSLQPTRALSFRSASCRLVGQASWHASRHAWEAVVPDGLCIRSVWPNCRQPLPAAQRLLLGRLVPFSFVVAALW